MLCMGILNLTPDSFSDGLPGALLQDFLDKAECLIDQGADILDVGGESTRPGAKLITLEEEKKRVLPFLEKFRKTYPDFPISLDTRKYEMAKHALEYQIQIINDTSFLADVRLLQLAKDHNLSYVLMHSRGKPQNMVNLVDYGSDFLKGIFLEIKSKLIEIQNLDFPTENLILDPGFGFAKTPEQSKEMMEKIEQWSQFLSEFYSEKIRPQLMIGISRKRFLQKYIGESEPIERDKISAELAVQAMQKGFVIVRTHNVALTRELFKNL